MSGVGHCVLTPLLWPIILSYQHTRKGKRQLRVETGVTAREKVRRAVRFEKLNARPHPRVPLLLLAPP